MYYKARISLPKPHELDSAVTGRCVSACWFAAAWGASAFQAALLKQVWEMNPHATPAACVASAWIIGMVVGLRVRYALRRSTFPGTPLVFGAAFLSCALGWLLLVTPWLSSRPVGGPVTPLVGTLALGAAAFLMGVASTCWLSQPRSHWPALGEQVTLARVLICLTLGLALAWILPTWARPAGLALLLPLLCIDLYPAARSPFPTRGGVADALVERSGGDPVNWLPLELDCHGSPPWWWITYLARRRYIPPTALALSLAIATGAIWYSVPTPFAANLFRIHQVPTLGWLVAGQLAALAAGGYVFQRCRGAVGAPDRLIPHERQRLCWRLALLSLFAVAASLALLGLPWLQAPWELAFSLALYTLAGAAWSILLARLRPSISAQAYSLRHLALSAGIAPDGGRLSYEMALENRVTLTLATWEGILTAIAAPLCGLLIDHTTFDDTLVLVGLALILYFSSALLALRLFQRAPQLDKHAGEKALA